MSRWCLITDRAINASHRIWRNWQHNQALLANHGPVVCGSLQEAANNMEELEETAKLIFILGDRPIRYLTAGEIGGIKELMQCLVLQLIYP